MTNTLDSLQTTTSNVVQGGMAVTAMAFFHEGLIHMIPYALPALALIALDLIWGVKAARYRGEKLRTSTALRRTLGKTMEYACWIILSSTLSLAFQRAWIEWAILGVVVCNEIFSIVENYLETRGVELSLYALLKAGVKALLKIGGDRIGSDLSDIDTSGIIKPAKKEDGQ